jgi:hypothetical protein
VGTGAVSSSTSCFVKCGMGRDRHRRTVLASNQPGQVHGSNFFSRQAATAETGPLSAQGPFSSQ